MAKSRKNDTSKTRKPKKPATYRGWDTSDSDEILIRRQRAADEPMRITRLTEQKHPFGDYQVSRTTGDEQHPYTVELRSLDKRVNSCTCPDFTKNGLGTCKHIEHVLLHLPQRRGKRTDSPQVEIFMSRDPAFRAAVRMPADAPPEVAAFLRTYLNAMAELKQPWETTLLVLLRDLDKAPESIQRQIRVSREIRHEADAIQRRQRLATARSAMAERLRQPENAPAIVRHRLYDYQQEGMLHLAFTGRALLADEMGLGKTVQAIAACKLLRDLEGIRRVLIVCPASLKTEWEEQIRKFTNLPITLVYGSRAERQKLYEKTDSFFVIANYEQILNDLATINNTLAPDVVILDEAQRIKNWQTKTARSIKRLSAPYAFVLTGTPLENRIDEIYSLVEFIDPHLFGSLFRFNRQFYTFDDRGRASGLKNMRLLHDQLKPIMLRRRKDQIAEQLPERVDNNYFVKMTPAQKARYEDFESPVAQLMARAARRPLTKAEMDKLQLLLNCMRMTCDSLYVLDQKTKSSPKIDELLAILDDIWTDDPTRKVIVFSEWERMLYLLAQALENQKLTYAWHTGSVAQHKRRDEINRFKDDPDCRLFLSTDSGATGLNLQVASVVVNLDLPWNPAKLEQRIARAWRKHQKNSVQVINLVTEASIEHRMLSTIAAKRELADGVLDARGDLDDLQLPNNRAAFLHRLEQITAMPVVGPVPETPPEPEGPPPAERFAQDLTVKLGDRLLTYRARTSEAQTVDAAFIVVESNGAAARQEVADMWAASHGGELPKQVHVLDRHDYELMQRLAESGIIAINNHDFHSLYDADSTGKARKDTSARRRELAEPLLTKAQRQLKMADLLAGGGFQDEAMAPLRKAADFAGCALAVLCATQPPDVAPTAYDDDLHQILLTHRPVDEKLIPLLVTEPGDGFHHGVAAILQATQEAFHRLALA